MPPSHSDGDAEEATRLTTLANRAQEQKDYAHALLLYQQALAIREQVFGPTHLEVAASLDNLAKLYQDQKQQQLRSEQRKLHNEMQNPQSKQQSEMLPYRRLFTAFFQMLAEEDQAIPLYERALAIREHALRPEHLDVATTLDNLAHLHQDLALGIVQYGLSDLSQYLPPGSGRLARTWVSTLVGGSV